MSLKNKFSRLGKILLFTTFLSLTPVSNTSPNSNIADAYEFKYHGEKISYMRSRYIYSEEVRPGVKRISTAQNMISVDKPNGKTVTYLDLWGDDFQVDRIGIEEPGKSKEYNLSKDTAMIFREGQERFDYYLNLIKEERAKKLLD